MRTAVFCFALLIFYLVCTQAHAQRVPTRAVQDANARCMMQWLTDRLWWRETSYNAGPGITEAIKANHGNPRDEYCGHTQAGANRSCGLAVPPGSGGSYNWFKDAKRLVYEAGKVGRLDSIRRGYKLGFYNARRGRIAHISATDQVVPTQRGRPPRGFWSIAGNEGSGLKAGMHRTFYPAANVYAASNYNY